MAGRGRGANLFRKLAQLEAEATEKEEGANVRPIETESTASVYQDTDLDAKFQDARLAKYATSETEFSVGSATFAGPMKSYMKKVGGDVESVASTDDQSISDAGKMTFNIGRGRGMFAIPAPKSGSTTDSDRPSKPVGTEEDVLPKLLQGRGRGLIFTSGKFYEIFCGKF